MKKVISVILACLLTLTVMTPLSTVFAWEKGKAGVDLRVGVLSDAHIGYGEKKNFDTSYVTKALKAYKEIGEDKLDGLAFLGDMVQYGSSEYYTDAEIDGTTYPAGTIPEKHYDELLSAVNAEAADLPKVWTMGNHEFAQYTPVTDEGDAAFIDMFETKVGQPLDYHTTIGGFDFIAGGCEQFLPGKATADWIMQEVNNAIGKDSTNATVDENGNYSFADGVVPNSTKPVFLTVHHSLGGTINGSDSNYRDSWMSTDLYTFLQNRPQVIYLSGHNHVIPFNPRTIHQDGFTTYQASVMDHGGSGGTEYQVNYGTVLEVTDGVVELHRIDLNSEKEIGSPWVIDVPSIVSDRTNADASDDLDHYYYSADKRTTDVLVAPTMPDDINFEVLQIGTATTITFDHCGTSEGTPYQNDDYVAYYKVNIYDETQTQVATYTYKNRYYDVTLNDNCAAVFTTLTKGSTYTAKVYPYSIYNKEGTPYVTEFTVPETDTVKSLKSGKTLKVEAEHYPVIKRDINTTSAYLVATLSTGLDFSNNGYISYTAQKSGQTASWNTKINVPVQDSYTINIRVQRNASYCGSLTYYLDGTSIGTRSETSSPYWLTETFTQTLTPGEHTLSVSATRGNGNAHIYLDYVEFIPATKGADLRVGVMGDSHIGGNNSTAYITSALNNFNKMSGGVESLDGLALTGDMVAHPSGELHPEYYDKLYEVINATNADTPLIYAMGNHEYRNSASYDTSVTVPAQTLFAEKTGQPLRYHTTFGNAKDNLDYHFITANAETYNGNYSAETQGWLMQEIDKAIAEDSTNANADGKTFAKGVIPNSTKPVFMLLHHPIQGTVGLATAVGYSDEFIAFLKTRPQVIVFTAHLHLSYKRAEAIWQDGFTVFETPLLSNGNVGYVGTDNFGGYPEHGAVMLEVLDNVVSLKVFNVETGEPIYDPWVIDVPAIVAGRTDADSTNDNDNYLYSADKRALAVAPYFPAGTQVNVKLNDRAATVSFTDSAIPTATENQNDGLVYGYRVELYDKEGNFIAKQTPATKYYLASYTPASGDTITLNFTGLKYNTEYTVKIYPLAPFATGEALETTFATDVVTYGESLTYELEDYVVSSEHIKTSSYASDGEYFYAYGVTEDPSLTIPVEIENAGYYDILYALGEEASGGYQSVVTVSLTKDSDGTVTTLGKNGSVYAEDISRGGQFHSSGLPMRIYESQYVYLDAGTYTAKVTVAPATRAPNKGLYMGTGDYLEFKEIQKEEDKTIILEAEDYKEITVVNSDGTEVAVTIPDSDICKTAKTGDKEFLESFSGTGWVKYNAYKKSYAYSSIPVEFKEAGNYVIEYYVKGTGKNTSTVSIVLDGTEYATNTTSDNFGDFVKHYLSITITEPGTHTVGLKAQGKGNGNCYFAYDYILIKPAETMVYTFMDTKINGEDMHTQNGGNPNIGYLKSDANADGGAYFYLDNKTSSDAGTISTVTLNVAETDFYDVTAKLYHNMNYSGYTVAIDGTRIGSKVAQNTATAWKTINGKVYLTKGTHRLTITSQGNVNANDNTYIDYVTIKRVDTTVTVPENGVLIEAESNPYLTRYLQTTTTTTTTDDEGQETTTTDVKEATDKITVTPTTDANASGGSVLNYNYDKKNTDNVSYKQSVTWEQPIKVQKAGKYMITYKLNQSGWYYGVHSAYLDGTKLGEPRNIGTEGAPTLTSISYLEDLTEGDHTISIKAERGWNLNCNFNADSVSIVPYESTLTPVEIGDSKVTVEMEDHKNDAFLVNSGKPFSFTEVTGENYSGGKALKAEFQSQSNSSNIELLFKINVEEEANYNVELSATGKEQWLSSGFELYIDDSLVTKTTHSGYTVMGKAMKNLTLSEGEHIVRVVLAKWGVNSNGTIDYVSFAPVEKVVFDAESNQASVVANIDTSGSVIVALYDVDGKVCGIYTENLTEAKTIRATEIACAKAPVSCKVFVWEDFGTAKPLVGARTISIE